VLVWQAHTASKVGILLGNGLPDLRLTTEIVQALKDVGFEVRRAHRGMSDGALPVCC
jgi:hypothetical protein